MSGWKDGYEEYPWCPTTRKPCPQDGKALCPVCREVVRAMDLMEGAIVAEKERHNRTELQNHQLQTGLEALNEKFKDMNRLNGELQKRIEKLEEDKETLREACETVYYQITNHGNMGDDDLAALVSNAMNEVVEKRNHETRLLEPREGPGSVDE